MAEASNARAALVYGLRASGAVRSVAVGDAFLAVPRERFLPGMELEAVYRDEPILTKTDESRASSDGCASLHAMRSGTTPSSRTTPG